MGRKQPVSKGASSRHAHQPPEKGWARATHHVLLFGHYLEERIVPLQDVNIQEMPRRKGALAEGADIPVQRVVVVLVALQCIKDLAAPRDVATEFRHPVGKLGHPRLKLH